jgi:hypothetical protein
MKRRLTLSTVDLVLVTVLLAVYGSTQWAWLGGPLSALAIWCIDCSERREAMPQPSRSTSPRTHGGTVPSGLESSVSRG